jgi:hypothetical protein
MEEAEVRQHAEAMCEALVAGDIDRATVDASDELRRHMGELVALLPLPVSEAAVESIERGGASFAAVLRLVGQNDTVRVQTRWKDRNGEARMVEASHLSREARAHLAEEGEAEQAEEG